MTVRRTLAAAAAGLLALAGCTSTGGEDSPETPTRDPALVAEARAPEQTVVLPGADAATLADGASREFFTSAPLVVVTDPANVLPGASAALDLGVPVLVTGDDAALAIELERLGTATVLAVGSVVLPETEDAVDILRAGPDLAVLGEDVSEETVPAGEEVSAVTALEPGSGVVLVPEAGGEATGAPTGTPPAGSTAGTTPTATATSRAADGTATAEETTPDPPAGPADLPDTDPAEPVADDVLVLTSGDPAQVPAVANARVAGAQVELVPTGDPRATSATVQTVATTEPAATIGLGNAFGDTATLEWRIATAATGVELPGGGQLALPGKLYVALYGTPGSGALGVLGEQDVPATIARAEEHAEQYRPLVPTTVVPSLEIIATIASAGAGPDGNYSAERPIEELRPLIEAAHDAGQYVVLDLQPGRTDFLTQAKLYEELLRMPNVGLALDPEWRLRPDQVHLRQIGQVGVEEVNQVVTWLADLTRANNLPQKVLILHQFQVRMIPGVNDVDLSRSELAVVIHVDGQGSQPAKQATWQTLHANAPNVQYWGWKNFYDEDVPMLSPEQTVQVQPMPSFISYQ